MARSSNHSHVGLTARRSPRTRRSSRRRPPRAAKATNANKEKVKKASAIDAAARVLGEAEEPMTCPEMIKAMSEKSYWTSPGGATSHATLYAAGELEGQGR